MFKSKFLMILGLSACILSASFFIFLLSREVNPQTLPVLGEVPDFRLKDSANKDFSLKDLKGKIWIADFIFTTCGSICPLMTTNMAQLHRSFLLDDRIELVSITVNPEYDTPVVLDAYAKKYGADPNKWHFLSGTREAITDLAVHGFKLGSKDDPIFHSANFVLLDRQGRVRGFYDGTKKKEISCLFKDVGVLLRESTRTRNN